ncbi:hypothetical protein [Hymenobacter actinosclerus]|uniref:Uncharacterized protein n=1 Tax=Hymenobacter actinosclerus TaxID=82805 RepID=A0A1I0E306_9BACT|nr:hypothetical protein [Hymenobacter actinosclerus]SET38566.1 hypothetical protein SAMN04487998_1649 [Hymenobacter actinosclerus]
MPKTIDYPRTSYQSAWEVAEVVDDTGGKCAIDTAARKLNRKVSGSFKAIIGSAVKFGLLTSKRELLTTTNLFRRIKNAYDKQEERIYEREAFLHPPLFTQICRKFRNRELPVHMFDVMLVREFGVEEINAQSVTKAFVDGARMAGILNEQNIIADIDQLAAQQQPRRELASTELPLSRFQPPAEPAGTNQPNSRAAAAGAPATAAATGISAEAPVVPQSRLQAATAPRLPDAVSSLFGLDTDDIEVQAATTAVSPGIPTSPGITKPADLVPSVSPDGPLTPGTTATTVTTPVAAPESAMTVPEPAATANTFAIHLHGPGLNTHLTIEHVDDLELVQALLNKIKRQLTE